MWRSTMKFNRCIFLFCAASLCSLSASATVITFEEIGTVNGGLGGRAFPVTIGEIDIGNLGVFDTECPLPCQADGTLMEKSDGRPVGARRQKVLEGTVD